MAARKRAPKTSESGRDKLHRLVDEIPDDETVVAELFLEYLKGGRTDAMLVALATAPWDDEPETEEEAESAAEAWQEYLRGEALSAEEAKRRLLS